ncbi:hypothetical protein [Companilactobacillus halodurans]|uniref:Uncharacterized protein n=1 Tax=Companilactobacillus halodurans TaxID=2584183 RepID=A0A5P0ZWV0_9LACO|nr:hypothetical protein [Companilactobacillus halodurans]MQS75162.1 hypothetical protein [Companilactobacillus halodurans]MQS97573.1 hypothetical protein [Companilactobacillus halodurans]
MSSQERSALIQHECQIRNNLKKIEFTHYFSNRFMEKYTQFFCIEDFLKSLGIINRNSLERIGQAILEKQVHKTTIFSSWQEMLDYAGKDYHQNKAVEI